jgi:hypothetical protein
LRPLSGFSAVDSVSGLPINPLGHDSLSIFRAIPFPKKE